MARGYLAAEEPPNKGLSLPFAQECLLGERITTGNIVKFSGGLKVQTWTRDKWRWPRFQESALGRP